jgi:hypothetical protein
MPLTEHHYQVKAEPADPVNGKPSWHGYFRTSRGWRRATTQYGPMEYTTPESAEAGAAIYAQQFDSE